jgi:SAM-dependent methyltransferase
MSGRAPGPTSLPFEDQSFDAAMALATVDHWQDPIAGLREMRRVARRVVVFTIDASDPDRFWLTRDYLPDHAGLWAHARRGMSIWARVGPDAEQRTVHSLRADLASGRWAERNRDLLDLDAAVLDSRLLIA